MRTDRIGRTMKVRRLRTRAVWLSLLAGVLTMAIAARLGGREGFAQSTAAPEAIPAQTNSQQNSSQADPSGGTDTPAAATSQPAKTDSQEAKTGSQAKPENGGVATDPKKKEIVGQSANLLKLANSLKAEVDKTSADTLSIAVIRQADEIEKLARKMRSK